MATAKASTEVRGNRRVTTILPVDCKIVELPEVQTSKIPLQKGQSFGGRTINVSKTGLLINSDYELDPKTEVEVTLYLHNEGIKKAIKALARVARARRNAYDLYGRWAMGLHFLEIDPKDLQLLSNLFLDAPSKATP